MGHLGFLMLCSRDLLFSDSGIKPTGQYCLPSSPGVEKSSVSPFSLSVSPSWWLSLVPLSVTLPSRALGL